MQRLHEESTPSMYLPSVWTPNPNVPSRLLKVLTAGRLVDQSSDSEKYIVHPWHYPDTHFEAELLACAVPFLPYQANFNATLKPFMSFVEPMADASRYMYPPNPRI